MCGMCGLLLSACMLPVTKTNDAFDLYGWFCFLTMNPVFYTDRDKLPSLLDKHR